LYLINYFIIFVILNFINMTIYQQLSNKRRNITPKEYEDFFNYMSHNHRGNNPISRNLMSKMEIKMAEDFVKVGLIAKGTSIEDGRIKVYYAE